VAEKERARLQRAAEPVVKYLTKEQRQEMLDQMFVEMKKAAKDLDFERAADLRDQIARLQAVDQG
jgi:excinuclease ABC subunit B